MTIAALDLTLRSGRLRAARAGPSEGPLAVCVPGLSANLRSFDAIVQALSADPARRTLALDLRGRGFSEITPPGTYGWKRHAEDVLAAAAGQGAAPFDLIGHSMGAFVAMQAAALAPERVRRLVLLDAAGVPEPSVVPPILSSVQRLGTVYGSAEAYLEQIERRGAAEPWDGLWRAHYLYDLEPARGGGVTPRTSKDAVMEDVVYGSLQDPSRLWGSLRMPTLLLRSAVPLLPGTGFLVGEDLRDAFLEAVPSARAVDVRANHYGVMADPAALQAIRAFLERP